MSEMKRIEFTEDQITAYALGELSASERTEIESQAAQDPALCASIAEVQEFAAMMKADLAAEPAPALTADQQRKVLEGKPSWFRRFLTPKALGFEAALAAALALVLFYPTMRSSRMDRIGSLQAPAEVKEESEMGVGAPAAKLAKRAAPADQLSQQYAADSMTVGGSLGGAAAGAAAVKGEAFRGGIVNSFVPREGGVNTGSESYGTFVENAFLDPKKEPLSTFSVNVDTASYASLRRFLMNGQLPPKDAVRIEEMVNYFTYSYPEPTGSDPFSVSTEVGPAPWAPTHRLMKIGLKGKAFDEKKRPSANLVFLVDVSGSMDEPNKLPLLKEALKLLVDKLDARDRVSLVTYASGSQVVLPATAGDQKDTIVSAIDRLVASGSTNGEGGIRLAYSTAQSAFVKDGANRVILATDGDFNVGLDSPDALSKFIEEKARSGVSLSVLGFGMGNYKDANLERLSTKGHGNYGYIDTIAEAKKLLVEQMGGTLFTIAKDVKLQLEFNPAEVNAYRLIGYENRLLAHEDFNNDQKAANDIGAGHTVTAIYEIIPKGVAFNGPGVDRLKYQQVPAATTPVVKGAANGELLTVKLRYKAPDSDTSKLLTHVVKDEGKKLDATSTDFKWAAAVAEFGMILRESPNKGDASYSSVLDLAQSSRGTDVGGYRAGMIEMMRKAKAISSEQPKTATPILEPMED